MALPPAAAFGLFTPSGERAWTDGWDPQFPVPVADETEPGSAFTTAHRGRETTWVVVHREAGVSVTYSCLTPGDRAELVSVPLEPSPSGSTAIVDSDLTALAPDRNPALEGFADQNDHFLAGWQAAIANLLFNPSARGQQDATGPAAPVSNR